MTDAPEGFVLDADVLVLGGGPAGAWAAITAAESGASVVLADKGRVGTSGATAAANTAVIDVAPGSVARRRVIERRLERGLGLAQADWIERMVDEAMRGSANSPTGAMLSRATTTARSIAAVCVVPTTCNFCAGAYIRPGSDFSITVPRRGFFCAAARCSERRALHGPASLGPCAPAPSFSRQADAPS